jgi:hypothetical protein
VQLRSEGAPPGSVFAIVQRGTFRNIASRSTQHLARFSLQVRRRRVFP